MDERVPDLFGSAEPVRPEPAPVVSGRFAAEVDPALLRQLIDYDPETGLLTWKPRPDGLFRDRPRCSAASVAVRWNARHAGRPALAGRCRGYRNGKIFGHMYRAHRVAWAIYFGVWPASQIDHVNGDRSDNRIDNLREVSRVENARNVSRGAANSSGVVGVSWLAKAKRWQASIGYPKRYLGAFKDFGAAVAARKAAEAELGYHQNHGSERKRYAGSAKAADPQGVLDFG